MFLSRVPYCNVCIAFSFLIALHHLHCGFQRTEPYPLTHYQEGELGTIQYNMWGSKLYGLFVNCLLRGNLVGIKYIDSCIRRNDTLVDSLRYT